MMAAFVQTLISIFFALRCSAREIAQERELIDRERLGGVRPNALLFSKIIFLFPMVAGLSIGLGLVLEILSGGLPSPLWLRLVLPTLAGLAFCSICLGISSIAASRERAHSWCLTLAFAQVLLAGALLGLPRVIGSVIHPFITAYFGWSGIIASTSPGPLHDAIGSLVRTPFADPNVAVLALCIHIFVGLIAARLGLRRVKLP
jgi:ABC transport system ATP-binding/permease protein